MCSSQWLLLSSLTYHRQYHHVTWLPIGISSVNCLWDVRQYSRWRVILVVPFFAFSVLVALYLVSASGTNSVWRNAWKCGQAVPTVSSIGAWWYQCTTYMTLWPIPTWLNMRCTAHFRSAFENFSYFSLILLACISSRSVSFTSICVLLSLVGALFAAGSTVAWYTGTALCFPPLPFVTGVGVTSFMRNGPVLRNKSLLCELVARRSVVNVVIIGRLRYTYCPTSIFFGSLRILLSWLPL